MPRKSIGETAMTDAERQARYRAARAAGAPVIRTRRPADHRSRARRWNDNVAGPTYRDVTFRSGAVPRKSIGETAMTDAERQARYRAGRLTIAAGPGAGTTTSPAWWKRRLSTPPGWNACRTAFRTARPRRPYERSAIWTSPNFRRSFRRAASAGIDHPSLTLTHVMHRDLPRPSLRATPKALRYGRGSLLCMTWISSRPPPMRGHDWTRKGGRNWKRFDKLQSHYLFADRFGRPGKGNDKGKVEGLVG